MPAGIAPAGPEIPAAEYQQRLAATRESMRERAAATDRSRDGAYDRFVPLVRTGERLLHEHATWTDRVLRPGDTVVIELSGSVRRYHAPMSRLGSTAQAVDDRWKAVVDDGLGHREYHRHHCGYLSDTVLVTGQGGEILTAASSESGPDDPSSAKRRRGPGV